MAKSVTVIPAKVKRFTTAPLNKPVKKRVAGYARVSTDNEEQLTSYEAQVDYYTKYIQSNPEREFVNVYADEGISATSTKRRDGFNRMIADALDGKIDLIITKSVSRFARNTVDTLTTVRMLKEKGVEIHFEKENIHTTDSEGELLLTLISAVVQNESLSQSENVKWGIRRKYETGSLSSVPCGKLLGYNKVDGTLVINEAEAEIVRRIYRKFLDGFSYSQIAKGLEADGILSEQGNTVWQISSIHRILRNEKFKGDTLFQKTYNIDYLTKKRAKNNGELHKYYAENSHPAIIDKYTWECVRLELLRQEQYCETHHIFRYHNSSKEHPLSARIICATCGRTYMILESKRVGEEGRKYWRCSSFRGKNGTPVEGRTFTPKPMALWSKDSDSRHSRYRAKHRKLPQERQMFCTDIEIPAGRPEQVFVKAWNQLISQRLRYTASFTRIASTSDDPLLQYRAKEIAALVDEGKKLTEFDYELSLKTLDHIEVTPNNKLRVVFLTGTIITF